MEKCLAETTTAVHTWIGPINIDVHMNSLPMRQNILHGSYNRQSDRFVSAHVNTRVYPLRLPRNRNEGMHNETR